MCWFDLKCRRENFLRNFRTSQQIPCQKLLPVKSRMTEVLWIVLIVVSLRGSRLLEETFPM
ncbi:hypothetical protein BT93_A0836 [Corymbia citriodora subsp. variegata]|uniref:Uncharacterized protein n=1 Tax=Corymbia citriodora subsp. variegata TaxID=360336 RepID=A0A8T0CPM5_CORYI|nr:hypothetical protein BT93_L0689 [Corymbia citriodora subsp. variegata]KAF8042336.1 hypothetical protein BT93_A0836 [Corymbia citriodora subsp. variegata]